MVVCRTLVLLLLLLVLALAGTASARSTLETPLDLSWHEADVVTVLRDIARATGKRLFVAPDVQGRISLEVKQVPAWQVLHLVLQPLGFDFELREGTLIVATPEKLGPRDPSLALFLDGRAAAAQVSIPFPETEWSVGLFSEGGRAAWRVRTVDRRYPWCGNSYETQFGWLDSAQAKAVLEELEAHPVLVLDPAALPPPVLKRVVELLPPQQRDLLLHLTGQVSGSSRLRMLLLSPSRP